MRLTTGNAVIRQDAAVTQPDLMEIHARAHAVLIAAFAASSMSDFSFCSRADDDDDDEADEEDARSLPQSFSCVFIFITGRSCPLLPVLKAAECLLRLMSCRTDARSPPPLPPPLPRGLRLPLLLTAGKRHFPPSHGNPTHNLIQRRSEPVSVCVCSSTVKSQRWKHKHEPV